LLRVATVLFTDIYKTGKERITQHCIPVIIVAVEKQQVW